MTTTTTLPLPDIEIDVTSTRSACDAVAGNTITVSGVPVGAQQNRVLVVQVGAEDNTGDCTLSKATATYRGLAMTRAASAVSDTNSWRACNGIFYLLNPPAGSGDVIVTFANAVAGLIPARQAGAYVLYNVAQAPPIVTKTAGADALTNPVNTSVTVSAAGAWVVDMFTQGNDGTFTSTQTGQVERWDKSICASSSSVSSTKEVSAAGLASLGWTHSSPMRYAHTLAAFARAGSL